MQVSACQVEFDAAACQGDFDHLSEGITATFVPQQVLRILSSFICKAPREAATACLVWHDGSSEWMQAAHRFADVSGAFVTNLQDIWPPNHHQGRSTGWSLSGRLTLAGGY